MYARILGLRVCFKGQAQWFVTKCVRVSNSLAQNRVTQFYKRRRSLLLIRLSQSEPLTPSMPGHWTPPPISPLLMVAQGDDSKRVMIFSSNAF